MLMSDLRDLVIRTRAGRMRASDRADATMTVSKLGDQGIESIIGVIYPPQVALVGFGAILERPWAVNGLLGVRLTVVASVSGVHAPPMAPPARSINEYLIDFLNTP